MHDFSKPIATVSSRIKAFAAPLPFVTLGDGAAAFGVLVTLDGRTAHYEVLRAATAADAVERAADVSTSPFEWNRTHGSDKVRALEEIERAAVEDVRIVGRFL